MPIKGYICLWPMHSTKAPIGNRDEKTCDDGWMAGGRGGGGVEEGGQGSLVKTLVKENPPQIQVESFTIMPRRNALLPTLRHVTAV